MKIRTEQIASGEDEIIIRYKNMNEEIERTLRYLEQEQVQIIGNKGRERHLLKPDMVYYFESVDNVVFAYTNDSEYETGYTLNEVENLLGSQGYFRCNKSFVINIAKIAALKSNVGNRIDAALVNGEHVIISRHYAKAFRELLKEGRRREQI